MSGEEADIAVNGHSTLLVVIPLKLGAEHQSIMIMSKFIAVRTEHDKEACAARYAGNLT